MIMPKMDDSGHYITNQHYREILKLDVMLNEADIPHELIKFNDGWQVIYPEDGPKRIMDAVEHFGSYGAEEDLLEIMGLLTLDEGENDSVLGYLTAENVFERIKNQQNEGRLKNGLVEKQKTVK